MCLKKNISVFYQGVNFELEQQGMKNQLQDLHRLLHFVDSQLCNYLGIVSVLILLI